MSLNQFTNLDFTDLKTQIKDYLRSNSNFTDFDFEGSNFAVLIDLLAYNSYITSFNTNMVVNEVFLDSATLRENVVSLARNIGYVPRSRKAAVSKITFTVDLTAYQNQNTTVVRTLKLSAGQVALGAVSNGNYIFSIPDDTTVPVTNSIATFENLDIYEGVYLTNTFTVDSSQTNQKFILPNTNIDTSTIRVKVTNQTTEIYTTYDNILNATSDTRFFLVQEIENEKYQILFGDGIIGKKPDGGSKIEVSYIVTNGSMGNGAFNFTFSGILKDNSGKTVTTGVSLILTQTKSQNGGDIESIDSIKYLAPRVYASQYRAVTSNDYKGIIPYIYDNVDSVTAYGGEELDPPQYGKVFIAIKPRNGTFLSQITKQEIIRSLKQYSIAGIKPEIIDLNYLFIEIDATVYYNANFSNNPELIRSKVLNTLTGYSKSSDINSFGGRFKYSKITSLIDDTDKSITSNITKIKMRRDIPPEVNKFATYSFCFGNKIHPKTEGYSVKSTGFTIDGLTETIYMADLPNSDYKTGKIFFFKLENNLPVIVKSYAGKIDYTAAQIDLDVIKITGTSLVSEIIEVQAAPESNDVVGLKELYLQVDVQKSVVNTIEDIITSGENVSATQFVPTSSYLNGKYTR
jgi:hypothetical protein